MRRRDAIGLLAVTAALRPLFALAQAPPKRVAVLLGASQATSQGHRSAFKQGLQQLSYVEGRDYEIEYRYADGDLTRLPALAAELVQFRPNVIVVGNSTAALAAKQATAFIPIVAASTFDPVTLCLTTSFARPEGNVTGIVSAWDTIIGKQLELGLELAPEPRLAGMLVDVGGAL